MKITDLYFIGLLLTGIAYCIHRFVLEILANRVHIEPIYDAQGRVIGVMETYKVKNKKRK